MVLKPWDLMYNFRKRIRHRACTQPCKRVLVTLREVTSNFSFSVLVIFFDFNAWGGPYYLFFFSLRAFIIPHIPVIIPLSGFEYGANCQSNERPAPRRLRSRVPSTTKKQQCRRWDEGPAMIKMMTMMPLLPSIRTRRIIRSTRRSRSGRWWWKRPKLYEAISNCSAPGYAPYFYVILQNYYFRFCAALCALYLYT